MREIKFRAWSDDRGMISPPFNLFIKDHMTMLMQEGGYFGYNGSSITLMQYTGLKDKNGVEIYEGDIVHYKDYSAYDGDRTEDVHYFGNAFKFGSLNATRPDKWEVIGNIYENPELLGNSLERAE